MSLPASSSDATAFWKPILDRRIEIVKDYQERVSASIRKCNHWAQLLPKGLNILQDSINYSLELLERLEGDKDELVDELRALSAANRPLAETALSMHKWRLLTKIISELDKNKPIFGITTWDDVEAFAKMYLGGVPTGWMLAEVAAWWSTRLLTLTRVSSQASTTCFDLDNEDWKLREMVVVFRGHILVSHSHLVHHSGLFFEMIGLTGLITHRSPLKL